MGRGKLLTVRFKSDLLGAADAPEEANLAAHRRSKRSLNGYKNSAHPEGEQFCTDATGRRVYSGEVVYDSRSR